MNQSIISIIAPMVVCIIALICFVLWTVKLSKNNNRFNKIMLLVSLFVFMASSWTGYFLCNEYRGSGDFVYTIQPYFIISGFVSLIALLMTFSSWLFRLLLRPEGADVANSNLGSADQAAVQLLSSDAFRSALSNCLPHGGLDTLSGLDTIPAMLQSQTERKRNATTGARNALIALVMLGTLFAGIVSFSGYVLIDEESVGTPRTINELKEINSKIADAYSRVSYTNYTDVNGVNVFDKAESRRKDFIKQCENANFIASSTRFNRESAFLDPDRTLDQKMADKQQIIDACTYAKNLSKDRVGLNARSYLHILEERTLLDQLFNLSNSHSEIRESTYTNDKDTLVSIEQLIVADDMIIKQFPGYQYLPSWLEESRKLTEKGYDQWHLEQNRTSELIKRLAVSLIVSGFFLAIMKYVANLYRDFIKEAQRADRDDLQIRKFVIAYKSSDGNTMLRRSVLEQFTKEFSSPPDSATGNESGIGLSKNDLDLAREVLSTLAKKM